jgi:hypothetical protein
MNSYSLMRGLDPRIQSNTRKSSLFNLDCRVEPGNEGADMLREVAR